MHQHSSQFVLDALRTVLQDRGRGQVRAVRAQERGQVEQGSECDVACQLDEVRPEALEVESECVGRCVDVQGLVRCLVPATSKGEVLDLVMLLCEHRRCSCILCERWHSKQC